jgi:hypothetical protein
MAWHGMAWHGMAWHGMAWHGDSDSEGGSHYYNKGFNLASKLARYTYAAIH